MWCYWQRLPQGKSKYTATWFLNSTYPKNVEHTGQTTQLHFYNNKAIKQHPFHFQGLNTICVFPSIMKLSHTHMLKTQSRRMNQGCRRYLLLYFPSIYLEGQCKSTHISFIIARFWAKNQIPYFLGMSTNHYLREIAFIIKKQSYEFTMVFTPMGIIHQPSLNLLENIFIHIQCVKWICNPHMLLYFLLSVMFSWVKT